MACSFYAAMYCRCDHCDTEPDTVQRRWYNSSVLCIAFCILLAWTQQACVSWPQNIIVKTVCSFRLKWVQIAHEF